MNRDALQKIETKDDGQDLERFQKMLKTVVSVPKDDIRKKEKKRQPKRASD